MGSLIVAASMMAKSGVGGRVLRLVVFIQGGKSERKDAKTVTWTPSQYGCSVFAVLCLYAEDA
jgi:hypothetical protein